jgi:hypothetical protein
MSQTIELPSGVTAEITVAPWADANALRKAIQRTMVGVNMDMNVLMKDATAMFDFHKIATDDAVEACLMKCFERVVYDGVKFTKDLLDDPKIGESLRKDYFPLSMEVIKANCLPFFDWIISRWKKLQEMNTEVPK